MNGARQHLVVLAAGGTGGHVFPAEALASVLSGRECRLALITDRRGGAFGGALTGIDTHHVLAGGVAGKSLVGLLRSAPELAIGTLQARGMLKRLAPQVVVGFGGYASVPTMLAATFGGQSTVIHEQNAVLGRANRFLAARVARIAVSFESSVGLPADGDARTVHTGMPVRPAITAMRDTPYPAIAEDGPIHVLVLGGSQGARIFSDVVPKAVSHLPEALRLRLRMAQQCRPEDLARTRQAYATIGFEAELASFFDDVPRRLAEAHLVLSRAGASTVAELTTVGRPAILVPYPSAVDDHQSANAHSIDEAGAGWLMSQDSFTPENLVARLEALFNLPAMLSKAAANARTAGRPDAASRLADVVCGLLPNGNTQEGRQAA